MSDGGPETRNAGAGRPVLEFDCACLDSPDYEEDRLEGVSLALAPGTCVLVQEPSPREYLPLADAACGLMDPCRGEVRIGGEPWSQLGPAAQAARRGRIGRVFPFAAWVKNLPVLDNVVLAQMHHSRRRPEELEAEAESLARRLGLEHLPSGRVAWVRRHELRVAEWVRAFMGGPELVILENPEREAWPEHVPKLIEVVGDACRRGLAVLWITDSFRTWDDPAFGDASRFVVKGVRVEAVGGRR